MIISVYNLKGGCGKSTIATNLAVAYTHLGYKVCLIDTDLDQASAMEWSSKRGEEEMYVEVSGKRPGQITQEASRLRSAYDVIIIDGTPKLSELSDRILLASDIVLIPMKPSYHDFRSTEKFIQEYREIKKAREENNLSRVQAYIILNEVKTNSKAFEHYKETVAPLDEPLLHSISNRVAYADAFEFGLGVVEWDDKKAREEIQELMVKIEEIVQLPQAQT